MGRALPCVRGQSCRNPPPDSSVIEVCGLAFLQRVGTGQGLLWLRHPPLAFGWFLRRFPRSTIQPLCFGKILVRDPHNVVAVEVHPLLLRLQGPVHERVLGSVPAIDGCDNRHPPPDCTQGNRRSDRASGKYRPRKSRCAGSGISWRCCRNWKIRKV